jgi:NADH-quinone oxidoreductase subunit N
MLPALLPFLILVLGLAAVLIADLVKPNAERSYQLALVAVVGAMLTELFALVSGLLREQKPVWEPIEQVLQFDAMSQAFSCLVLFLAFLAIGISWESFEEEQSHAGEYYGLMLTAAFGAILVAHAEELLTFFLAFELLSIPLYVLVGFRRYHRKSSEAGLKYFLSGALSTAIFLFGASWVFGASGTTHFKDLPAGFDQGHGQPLVFGLILILGTFAFKISAAPFHMWAPDTYEGAPIPVAAFLSSVPKVAMFAVAARLLLAVADVLSDELMLLVAALAILSIVIGNLVALTQNELTRMAAYSGVAQIGYLLIGLSALVGLEGAGKHHLTVETLGSLFFYLLVYTVTNIAFWLIILTVGKARNSTELDAFDGLGQSSPFLAFCLLIAVFSLAGIPPLAGFVGKLYLFRAAFYSQPLMAFFGVLGSVISLYYYFNILRRCYFLKPSEQGEAIVLTLPTKGLLSLLLVLTLVGGLYPGLTQTCFYLAERMLIQ